MSIWFQHFFFFHIYIHLLLFFIYYIYIYYLMIIYIIYLHISIYIYIYICSTGFTKTPRIANTSQPGVASALHHHAHQLARRWLSLNQAALRAIKTGQRRGPGLLEIHEHLRSCDMQCSHKALVIWPIQGPLITASFHVKKFHE